MKQKRKGSSKRQSRDFSNRLPSHIGQSFERDLASMVSELVETYGGFKPTYLLSELFSKYRDESVVSASERATAAIAKWLDVEQDNANTNIRLFTSHEETLGWTSVAALVSRARMIISDILGPFDYDSILCVGVHTNGASTRVRRGPTAAAYKFDGVAHCSSSALPHWFHITAGTRLEDQPVELVESSVMFTVPKKSDIDRVACKEPEINMLLQRSVGKYIRRRLLRRVGINLRDQGVNQDLARHALAEGLATIDLSSASDSVTHQLVLALLPWEYYRLMDELRVKSTEITLPGGPSRVHQLEMFSSMGNGFTFELESLLFFAITKATMELSGVKGKISVYGDDIIAPSKIVPRLKNVLHFLGFKMNPKKTHSRGRFRESCGKHYYDGSDVTPFYIREPVRKVTDLIRVLNQLLIWDSMSESDLGFWTEEVARFHQKWAKHVPSVLHGGYNPRVDTSLVTGDSPRYYIDLEPARQKAVIEEDGSRRYREIPVLAPAAGQLTQWLVSSHVREDRFDWPWDLVPELGELSDRDWFLRLTPYGLECLVVTAPQTSKPRLRRLKRSHFGQTVGDVYYVVTHF